MKISRKLAALVAATALVAGGTTVAIAGAAVELDPATNVTGCLTTSGTGVGKIGGAAVGNAPQRSCTGTESKVTLSSGDITSVRGAINGGLTISGSTLLSGNVDKSGEAEIGIAEGYKLPQYCDPGQIPMRVASNSSWSCANTLPLKRIIQGRAWGPGRIATDWSRIGGSLLAPAGKWLIQAHVHFGGHVSGSSGYVDCRLGVGGSPATDQANRGSSNELSLTTTVNAANTFRVSVSCMNGAPATPTGPT